MARPGLRGTSAIPGSCEIADRLPTPAVRRHCPGDLPESWVLHEPPPRALVLHRANLTATDVGRLARLRGHGESPTRVILCVGPHVRHDDLVRSSRVFDAVLPEATAAETIARHLQGGPRTIGPGPSGAGPGRQRPA
jgi:hypothetical protein